jgi:hypothetical protein
VGYQWPSTEKFFLTSVVSAATSPVEVVVDSIGMTVIAVVDMVDCAASLPPVEVSEIGSISMVVVDEDVVEGAVVEGDVVVGGGGGGVTQAEGLVTGWLDVVMVTNVVG